MFFFHGLDGDTPNEFHERLTRAYETSSLTPDKQHGRFVWISQKLRGEGITASPESVRKWFAGLTRPRGDTMAALAKVIGVSEQWLEHGDAEGAASVQDASFDDVYEHMKEHAPQNIVQLDDFLIDFENPSDLLSDDLVERSRETRENALAAYMVSARLLFAGIEHRHAKSRILFESGNKAREIAVVLMHKVANRGGAWVARLPEARSGFEPYTSSFDLLMFILPQGGNEPAIFVVRGSAAAKLGQPNQVVTILESGNSDEPQITLSVGDKQVPVDPIKDLSLLTRIGG
ncbi:helix-turn-helix domain-containing protein [Paenirhodobacter populi]|uniref:Helix-turn-helix domain-containing protein n=1 Tax=Paenirhodobacter populi TaxID=2306993 RepID=A0A443J000_9RHOB|nr:helix-turn-helix domain-containing protein [Sinirhodobacter populi]RWR13791.1 helix-turn-helix domain-containing protein [Sinirhodobacter populi]